MRGCRSKNHEELAWVERKGRLKGWRLTCLEFLVLVGEILQGMLRVAGAGHCCGRDWGDCGMVEKFKCASGGAEINVSWRGGWDCWRVCFLFRHFITGTTTVDVQT